MQLSGDRYSRDLRRYQLALRLIKHNARTGTVCRWTGLSQKKIRGFYQSYCREQPNAAVKRGRGPSPHNVNKLMGSVVSRNEAAVVGALCRMYGIIPPQPVTSGRREAPSLAKGEALCSAFELYRRLLPEARLSIEEVVLLVTSLVEGTDVTLDQCNNCQCSIVLDRYSLTARICSHCRRDQKRGAVVALDVDAAEVLSTVGDPSEDACRQIGLF